nr:kinesin-like protein KIN-14Q [Tanacetum cinerariifolium]
MRQERGSLKSQGHGWPKGQRSPKVTAMSRNLPHRPEHRIGSQRSSECELAAFYDGFHEGSQKNLAILDDQNEVLMREVVEEGFLGVKVTVTPMHTEIIIRAILTQNVVENQSSLICFKIPLISPNENDLSESLSSLNFASRVRGIEFGSCKEANRKRRSSKIQTNGNAEKYKHEMKNKDLQIKKLEDNFHGLDMKLKEKELKNKRLQDKLTHLLQDSLGGDLKTLMFVQISPNENDLSELLCSLNFASRETNSVGSFKEANRKHKRSKIQTNVREVQARDEEQRSADQETGRYFHGLDMKLKEEELKNKNMQIRKKTSTQHVDTKIAEQQMKQQHQNQTESTLSRQSFVSKPLNTKRSFDESKENQPNNIIQQPLAEKNAYKLPAPLPPARDLVNLDDCTEKKNNKPYFQESFTFPKRTGRASICTTTQRVPMRSVPPRRNSLIPLPSSTTITKFVPPFPSIVADDNENVDESVSSIAPLAQQIRKIGGLNVAVERVRVSIGLRGRMAHRFLVNGRKSKLQNCMDRQRRWNIGVSKDKVATNLRRKTLKFEWKYGSFDAIPYLPKPNCNRCSA